MESPMAAKAKMPMVLISFGLLTAFLFNRERQ
jgi:hypothetical protein